MEHERSVRTVTRRERIRRRLTAIALVAVLGLAATACGDDADAGPTADDPPATTAAPTTTAPPTTTMASWADADAIVDDAPEQILPELAELIALIDAENAALGATDNLHYDEEDQGGRVAIEPGACTQVAFASFFYDANVGLTETPSVGLLAPGITASVCEDDAAAAERATSWYGFVDLDQGPCPIDERDESGLGILVCPRQPGEELRWWSAAAVGMTERVLFWINADFGPDTDPAAGAESLQAMLDALFAHVGERLA